MKFLFINPSRTIDTGNIWSTVNAITPPLGLATLAAVLEQGGHQADIIDMAAMDLAVADVLGAVGQSIDCIGITATTPEIKRATEIAAAVRAGFPHIKVIMGGVHPTVFHQELVANNDCDIVVRGEGEQIIQDIAKGMQFRDIPGITWKNENGEVVVNPASDRYVDLNLLPFPTFEKLPMKRYRSALGAARRSPSIGVITSRGCPGTCTFCFSGMFGTKIRFMTAERVLELISYLKTTFGIREISFYDDTFTAHKPRVEELCNALIRERMNISWSCFARVDSVKPDLLKLMHEAGCHQIMYGFESADDAILTGINKRVKSSSYETIVQWTRAAKIDIRGAFMLGNSGETVENLKQTIEYSKKMGIQFAIYNITTPFPGTQLYKKMEEQGYLKHRDWELYDLAHAAMNLPTVASHDVERYYSLAYRSFYFRPGYLLQRIAAIRTAYQFTAYWKVFWGMLTMLFFRGSKGKKEEQPGR